MPNLHLKSKILIQNESQIESGIRNQESLEVQNQNLNSRFIIPDSFIIHNS